MKRKALLFAVAILLVMFVGSIVVCTVDAVVPIISVTPASTTVAVGEEFTVNVTLSYAANLYGFEWWMSFDKTKLQAMTIDYMGYLNEPTFEWYNQVDNASGWASLSVSSQGAIPGETGGSPPPLATIRFKAIAAGTSDLHLYDTHLTDDSAMEITHTTSDSQVTITGAVAPPVGGIWEPISTLAILAPWIWLALAIAASAAIFGLFRRHRKKEII